MHNTTTTSYVSILEPVVQYLAVGEIRDMRKMLHSVRNGTAVQYIKTLIPKTVTKTDIRMYVSVSTKNVGKDHDEEFVQLE